MRVFIVYAHPSENSFTHHVKDSFITGLEYSGHNVVVSDLYRMHFQTDMSESEYLREAMYRKDLPLPPDVQAEQKKIIESDAITFIYPVFWSDAPAKLVGWFDRVWTFGFAYGKDRIMTPLYKGLVLCVAGNTMQYFKETGLLDSMQRVMLEDRLFDRVKTKEMIIFDATSREYPDRESNWERHLQRAFDTGRNF
ncbi:flavodoxin family protein [Spirochaetia bacterium]|nr:flavodoxin family protein [Spirochaetia bacterium]GHU32290.1 flavodoxin family protein [Spirochaetia bacterium]